MSRNVIAVVMTKLGGMLIGALLVASAVMGQGPLIHSVPGPHGSGGYLLAQAPRIRDDSRPCDQHGTSKLPCRCAVAHGGLAMMLPRAADTGAPFQGARAPYPVTRAPRAQGIRVTPALPPPRATA
ncbi:MAG TPA: hypothetical protein VHO91_01940 [Rhodopila sp.]|nr:hypothetical protein [Rhodopila sp.]